MKKIVFAIGILFLLSSAYALTKEEIIKGELVNNMMPAGEPTLSSGTVAVIYNLSLSHGNQTYARDSMFILGKLAKNYPESRYLEVVGVSGNKKIYSIKAETKDVIDYAEMQTGENDLQKKLIFTDYVSDCGAGKVQVNGNCVQETKTVAGSSQAEEENVIEVEPMWLVGGGIILLFGFGFIVLLIITIVILRKKKKEGIN